MHEHKNISNNTSTKSKAIANNISSNKTSNRGYLPFEDNRPIAITQRMLNQIANSGSAITQFALPGKKLVPKKKTSSKGKKAAHSHISSTKKNPISGGKGKPVLTNIKRPTFLKHVKNAREVAKKLKKKKKYKKKFDIHMAHRLSWEKISSVFKKGDVTEITALIDLLCVPKRAFGKIKAGDQTLKNEIDKQIKIHGLTSHKVMKIVNSSKFNLRPGNGKKNSAIKGRNDPNYDIDTKIMTPTSQKIVASFPDGPMPGIPETSSYMTQADRLEYEKQAY